jgi:hypothetical protein
MRAASAAFDGEYASAFETVLSGFLILRTRLAGCGWRASFRCGPGSVAQRATDIQPPAGAMHGATG